MSKEQQGLAEETKIEKNPKDLFPTPEQLHGDEVMQSEETKKETNSIEAAFEELAKKQGWIHPDEYKGDKSKEELVSAREYLEGNPLSHKLKSLKDDNKELKRTNDAILKMLQQQTEKYALEQAQEIQRQKHVAIEEGNVQKTEELEKKYNEVMKEVKKESIQSNADTIKYQQFVIENANWWEKNDTMTEEAAALELQLRNNNPELSVDQRLMIVKGNMIQKYPEYFIGNKSTENINRIKPQTVEGKSAVVKPKSEITFNDLPSNAKNVVRQMLQSIRNQFTDEQYYKKLDEHAKKLVATGAVSL